MRTIATPAHTRGHVVFADDGAGLLLAGDLVLPRITPSIGFESDPPARPLAELDPFNAMPAALETLAHLDVLVARRVLVESVPDGLSYYAE